MIITVDYGKITIPTGTTLNKAISSAINKTIVTAKKEMSAGVRKVYNIKKKDLDSKITVKKASQSNTESIITIRSKPIGLIHFNATASKAFDKGQKRYFKTSAKVMKNSRKKVYKGAFIGRAKNSKSYQVFRRTTNKRLPIVKMSVYTPTTMVKKEGKDDFFRVMERDFNDKFNHELKFYIGKQK